jgi:hypothetical protein
VAEPAEPPTEPPPSSRGRATLRDLIGAVAVLLVVVAAVAGFGRGCSFSPGGPTVDPTSAPSVDAAHDLSVAAGVVDFPVRHPAVPPDWRANSSSTAAVGSGDGVVVRVGWLTPNGRFLQLSQSNGDPEDVVVAETDVERAQRTGDVEVNGSRWTTYRGRRDEPAWVAQLDRSTVLITGSAGEAEFRTLAAAVRDARPLPTG